MISAGYCTVTREKLESMTTEEAKQFLDEMFNCGGRIGHHEYKLWVNRLPLNIKGKE